jgi:hypothetical protein
MSASTWLKHTFRLIAALALVALGLVSLSSMPAAQATDTQPCTPSAAVDEVSDWRESPPDGRAWQITDTRTKAGTGTAATTERVNFAWTGSNTATAPPVDSDFWQPNQGAHNGVPHQQPDNTPYQVGNSANNASWFIWKSITTPGIPAVLEHIYELHIAEVKCPNPEPECPNGDFNGTDEGCGTPPVEKKIVVCKYVGTPPGELHHIVIVNENTLSQVVDDEGKPFTGQFPFSWTDAQGQTTEGSKAIRYATDGEQAKDVLLSECNGETPPEECPGGDFNGEAEGCGEPPVECPDGDFNGEAEGCGEPPVICPEEDNEGHEETDETEQVELLQASEESEQEEDCDEDDDEDCEEHPQMDQCKEPPVIGPGDGEDNGPGNNPGKNPSTNPGNSPSANPGSNPQGSNQPNNPVAPALAPGAQVPSAVDAGLAPTQSELTGSGGGLGLLGIGTALVGAVLLGASFRPRRRIEAK